MVSRSCSFKRSRSCRECGVLLVSVVNKPVFLPRVSGSWVLEFQGMARVDSLILEVSFKESDKKAMSNSKAATISNCLGWTKKHCIVDHCSSQMPRIALEEPTIDCECSNRTFEVLFAREDRMSHKSRCASKWLPVHVGLPETVSSQWVLPLINSLYPFSLGLILDNMRGIRIDMIASAP